MGPQGAVDQGVLDALNSQIATLQQQIALLTARLDAVAPPPPTICQDPAATNMGGPLPCTYPPPPTTCQDPTANNCGGPLPCTFGPPPPGPIAATSTSERLFVMGYMHSFGNTAAEVFNAETKQSLALSPIAFNNPEFAWMVAGQRHVYTRSYIDTQKLFIWDPNDMSLDVTIDIPEQLQNFAASVDGSKIFVGGQDAIYVVDDTTRQIASTISLAPYGGAFTMRTAANGNLFVFTIGPNGLVVIRIDTGGIITGEWPVANWSTDMAVNGDYVAMISGASVDVLNAVTGAWQSYPGLTGNNQNRVVAGFGEGLFAVVGTESLDDIYARLNRINAVTGVVTELQPLQYGNVYDLVSSPVRDAIYWFHWDGVAEVRISDGNRTTFSAPNPTQGAILPRVQ